MNATRADAAESSVNACGDSSRSQDESCRIRESILPSNRAVPEESDELHRDAT